MAPDDCLRSLRDGQTLETVGRHVRLPVPLLEVVEDLADAEQAHRDHDEVEAVGELQAVEGEAVGAGEASRPTVASSRPIIAAIMALTGWPLPMVATSRTPSRASAAYSGGPKSSAQPATTGARSVSAMIEIVAPMNEPIAAMPSAVPAFPCLASAKPSKTVTTDDASPGSRSRTEVMVPPYCAP